MGQLFANLTRSGVQSPDDGQTTFQNSPAATAQALAAASAKTAQPGTSTVDGTIGAPTVTSTQPAPPPDGGIGPVQDNIDTVTPGQDKTTVGNSDAPIGAQPKLVHPTWAQANASKDPSSELTNKGTVLSLLLDAAQGAANGWAAGVPTNPHISPGLGPSLAAGFNTPFMEKQKQNALTQEGLEQEKEKAQIASLPLQAASQRALITSEIGRNNAIADTRGSFTSKPGDIRYDKNGDELGRGEDPNAVAASKQSGKLSATASAVKAAGGTPEQVLSALGVKNPTQANISKAQMYLDSNEGDPTRALAAMQKDGIAFHTALPAARKSGGGGTKDFGAAPAGRPEGSTGTLSDGTKVVVRGGRLVAQ